MTFHLHPRLKEDCIALGQFELSQLLMMNDSQFPWFILVPQKENIREIFELTKSERILLMEESSYLAEKLASEYQADKMNIAAIGNLVPQLHVHHIVRYQHDKAWPMPVWGKFSAVPYSGQQILENQKRLGMSLGPVLKTIQ